MTKTEKGSQVLKPPPNKNLAGQEGSIVDVSSDQPVAPVENVTYNLGKLLGR